MIDRRRLKAALKHRLVVAGHRRLPISRRMLPASASRYVAVGQWLAQNSFPIPRSAGDRFEIFDQIASEIGDKVLLYVEFGVASGKSLRFWLNRVSDPRARFHGFDTFWGLPEEWTRKAPRGAYSQRGRIPEFDDSRVTLYVGPIGETLPAYEPPPHEVLVVNFDVDVYSSTRDALSGIAPHLRPGTYLYFDEFSHEDHELRAFDEFKYERNFGVSLELEASGFDRVLFRAL